MKKLLASLLALASVGATTLATDSAEACGGCFHAPTENTVVTGHRMAVSISKTQAVLWDSIQYAGDPSEFSWVLPVKKGAYVEVSSDAFFDVLEAATVNSVQAPPEGCATSSSGDGFGCSSSEFASPASDASFGTGGGEFNNGVEVVHEGTVGPYETVTLSAENPNALAEWLEDNGYELPDSVKPIINAYVAENFDFIALRMRPNQGVASMKPVRVISPGSNYSLPLRMVAAGVGESVDLVLYVIGEGRYEAADFQNGTIDPKLITWDFQDDRSDYALQRIGLLKGNNGRSWLTSYSRKNAVLGTVSDPISGNNNGFNVGNSFAGTLAEAYFRQGLNNDPDVDVDEQACIQSLNSVSGSDVVTNLCDEDGNCATANSGETDARLLTCGSLDDIAKALEGMHPEDVFVTRMEANLPVEALNTDLRLQASMDQSEVISRFEAGLKVNPCWDQQDSLGPIVESSPKHRLPPGAVVLLTLGAAGIALAMRRRATAVVA